MHHYVIFRSEDKGGRKAEGGNFFDEPLASLRRFIFATKSRILATNCIQTYTHTTKKASVSTNCFSQFNFRYYRPGLMCVSKYNGATFTWSPTQKKKVGIYNLHSFLTSHFFLSTHGGIQKVFPEQCMYLCCNKNGVVVILGTNLSWILK